MGTLWTATLLLAATAVNAPPAAPPAPLADMEVPAGEAATPPIVFNADQVRCQAANQSSIAKLFVHEAAELRREEQNRKHPEKSCCPDRVLLHLADARRGQDAAAALILAFKLVVIEQREQQLLRAQTRVSEWRAAIEKLSDTSGEQPDDAALQVQEDRLPDALTRLRSGREKLQLQLASMLNCSVEQARLIAINEPLDPMPGPVDAVAGPPMPSAVARN